MKKILGNSTHDKNDREGLLEFCYAFLLSTLFFSFTPYTDLVIGGFVRKIMIKFLFLMFIYCKVIAYLHETISVAVVADKDANTKIILSPELRFLLNGDLIRHGPAEKSRTPWDITN